MHGDLAELALAHLVGGLWRAPLGTRLRAVPVPPGWGEVRIVEADDADCVRARALMRAGDAVRLPEAVLTAAVADAALAEVRRAEGGARSEGGGAVRVPGAGPLLVLGARGADPCTVAAVLAECAAAARAVLFKPAPGAAVSGALLCRGLSRAGWSGLSMVQGGAETGARLVALGGGGAVLVVGAARLPAGLRGVAVLAGSAPGIAMPG